MSELASGQAAARAVVIDPDPLWPQAVTAALARLGVSVVANSANLSDAPELAEAHAADLLFVGLGEERHNREVYRLLRQVHTRRPNLVTVVIVPNANRSTVDAALTGGAYWILDRRMGVATLVGAVVAAYRAQREVVGTPQRFPATLTRRELQILRLVADGRPDREVAKILWVTHQTIEFHLANICKKLEVRDRAGAVRWAIARGLVGPWLPDDDGPTPGPGAGALRIRRTVNLWLAGSNALDPARDKHRRTALSRSSRGPDRVRV